MNPVKEPMRIRPMSSADLPRVMEIAQSLKDAPHWPESVWTTAVDCATGPDVTPRRICLVAADPLSGIVLAFAVTGLLPPQAELESIAVAAEHQRRGIASGLFAGLVRELKAAGIHEIFLEVRDSNRAARGFYRAQGFSETGRRVRYYADPIEDAVLMSLRLE